MTLPPQPLNPEIPDMDEPQLDVPSQGPDEDDDQPDEEPVEGDDG